MPGLTITEKEHWKERIGKRIEKKIEVISAEDPNLLDRVQREARQRALVSLGLADMQQERDAIEQQQAALDKRDSHLEFAMIAHIRGVSVDDVNDRDAYRHAQELHNAIQRRRAIHEDELLASDEIGQRILTLREEKDNLLDVVWLATSPKQIKELWTKVAELLDDSQTQLQRDALAIVPVDD